ncbi:hypothetical protein ABBQ38_002481 [Trebouxia sp. C0009 RCD-2024]
MHEQEVYRFSRTNSNFPDLQHAEADIADTFQQLLAEHEDLKRQVGPDVKLVCDLSQNYLLFEHLVYFTSLLVPSLVSLLALDLSWNRICVSRWEDILPVVSELLTKATYVDLAGNYLPAISQSSQALQGMLTKNAKFATPNVYLGNTLWIRAWTAKAHHFRQQAYREEGETLTSMTWG